MKKLLLLFIPLMFFFGCEPDEESENNNNEEQSIVGVWKDGGGTLTMDTSVLNFVLSVELNPLLFDYDGCDNQVSLNLLMQPWIDDMIFDIIGNQGWVNYSGPGELFFQDYEWVDDYVLTDPSNNKYEYIYLDENHPFRKCLVSEMLVFNENGTWSYMSSPNDFIINDWWLSEGLETHIEDWAIGFGATDSLLNSFDDPLIPIPGDVVDLGFETTRSGIWSIINNTLTLTCFDPNGEPMNSLSYNFTVNGDDLTIDLSLVGNEVYISTWERQ